jgi:hypothetical protein
MSVDPALVTSAIVAPLVGVVVFNLLAVVRGWLIPRWTYVLHTKLLTDEIDRITNEKDEWRAAAQAMEAVNQEVRAQNRLLLEGQKTSTYAWEQIRRAASSASTEGGDQT